MVGFGKQLLRERRDIWADSYVNYQLLKSKLKEIIAAKDSADGNKDQPEKVQEGVAGYQAAFDVQVKKVLGFYNAQLRCLELQVSAAVKHAQHAAIEAETALKLNEAAYRRRRPPTEAKEQLQPHLDAINRQLQLMEPPAREVVYLLQFISLNLVALRKIVKKFAKHVAPQDPSPGCLSLEVGHPDDAGWRRVQATYLPAETATDLLKMQHHQGLLAAATEIRSVAAQLQNVRERVMEAAGIEEGEAEGEGGSALQSATLTEDLHLQVVEEEGEGQEGAAAVGLPGGTRGAGHKAGGGGRGGQGRMLSKRHSWVGVLNDDEAGPDLAALSPRAARKQSSRLYVPPAQLEDGPTHYNLLQRALSAIQKAENEVRTASGYVRPIGWWERQAGVFEAQEAVGAPPATLTGLIINNFTCFAYMANYMATVPFVEPLCEHLGVSVGRAGTIIGMSDLANLVATFVYSYWVTSSFKSPLIASCTLAMAGNFMFVGAYQWRSYPALLAARLVMGFGSARSVNRQYIADHVKTEHRTAASASFVMASVLGTSAGPFAALPLSWIKPFEWRGLAINPITCTGWMFVLLWLMAGVGTVLLFKDPGGRASRPEVGNGTLRKQGASEDDDDDDDESDDAMESGGSGHQNGGGGGSSMLEEPLLASAGSNSARGGVPTTRKKKGASQRMPPIAIVCLVALLLLKTVQQVYMDGIPLFTGAVLGWGQQQVGLLIGVMGLAMLPVNALVMVASSKLRLEDRHLMLVAALLSITGLVSMGMLWLGMGPYFAGGSLLFAGTLVWEASSMSLMSKAKLPDVMRRPPLSDGLLTTQAGTLGRFAGNGLVSAVAEAVGLTTLALVAKFSAVLHFGLAGACAAVLAYTLYVWRQLKT